MKIKWILIFVVFCISESQGFGAAFPKGAQIEIMSDFSGGLNTVSPANKIPKNFSPNMKNVFIHRQPGKIIKRNGFIKVGIASNTIASGRFAFTFYKENGGKEFIVSDDSVVLSTKDFLTYVFISSALNTTLHLQAAQIRNKVWFTNGSDPIFTWDGTVMQKLDGTGGTPNVPKFRYIGFYQERVFGLNTTADRSSLNWSDVASTGGIAIAPDSYLAWPAGNSLSIGQGDGQVGTALWVYAGQLQVGKERSIYTLYGTNTASYNARRTENWSGPISQDAVIVMDDLTYYKALDGIYAYNGSGSARISDVINPNVQNIQDAVNQIVSNSWEIQSDFAKGNFFGTTATATGLLAPIIKQYGVTGVSGSNDRYVLPNSIIDTVYGSTNGNNPPALTPSVTFYGPTKMEFLPSSIGGGPGDGNTSAFDRYSLVYPAKTYWTTVYGGPACDLVFASVTFSNTLTGEQVKSASTTFNGARMITDFTTFPSLLLNGYDLLRSSIAFKVEGCGVDFADMSANGEIQFVNSTTVQFLSEVSTVTTITAWGNFESLRNTNGGNINYFIRSATSVVNMTTQTWFSASPGVVVPFDTNNLFFQWASTLTSISSYTNVTNIDNVTIAHIEGAGSKDRPFAINWKNEYWLSVATETSGNLSVQYVKSWITNPNPHAWQSMESMNLRSFTKDGNTTLYGGGASTSSFYRLDYGTNDNGQAIDSFYETSDITLRGALTGGYDGNWMQEQLHEYWLDFDGQNGATFRLGRSLDGNVYVEDLIDMAGTGRVLKILYNPNQFAKYFRWRFRNNGLDESLNLNNFAVIYQPLLTR